MKPFIFSKQKQYSSLKLNFLYLMIFFFIFNSHFKLFNFPFSLNSCRNLLFPIFLNFHCYLSFSGKCSIFFFKILDCLFLSFDCVLLLLNYQLRGMYFTFDLFFSFLYLSLELLVLIVYLINLVLKMSYFFYFFFQFLLVFKYLFIIVSNLSDFVFFYVSLFNQPFIFPF